MSEDSQQEKSSPTTSPQMAATGVTAAAAHLGSAQQQPPNAQDLSMFVTTLLQQMQTKFETMSDTILGRSELDFSFLLFSFLCFRLKTTTTKS